MVKYTELLDTINVEYTVRVIPNLAVSSVTNLLGAYQWHIYSEPVYLPNDLVIDTLDNLPMFVSIGTQSRSSVIKRPYDPIDISSWYEAIHLFRMNYFIDTKECVLIKNAMELLCKYIPVILLNIEYTQRILHKYVQGTSTKWHDVLYLLTKYCDFPKPIESITLEQIINPSYLAWLRVSNDVRG